jgi:hypothetical protein
MGTDRDLAQSGYWAVDYCSLGRVLCVHQYVKGRECLRVTTQGEQIRFMRVQRWNNECRERGPNEVAKALPGDVRYLRQWRDECESEKECRRAERFARWLEKKYVQNLDVLRALSPQEADSRK